MGFDYQAWIKQAQDRLALLRQQRAAIDAEIATLEKGIDGFLETAAVNRIIESNTARAIAAEIRAGAADPAMQPRETLADEAKSAEAQK